MNKIIDRYLIINFTKIVVNTILIFLSLGVILNLFEEIEFVKNLDISLSIPFVLSLSFVPTLVIELLPFVFFLASMYYFVSLKTNKDLLSVKIFGYSNLKITIILAFFSFLFGWFILFAVNPITSTFVKYYETEKAKYSRDVDHLIAVNKNGVWIKEIGEYKYKIINAEKFEGNALTNISIYIFTKKNNELIERIESETAIISSNPWKMNKVFKYDIKNNKRTYLETYEFETEKFFDQINSLFKNLNTVSFVNLVKNYKMLQDMGYPKKLLDEKIHKFISLPFFLFLMVVLAAIFSIGSLNTKQNYYYILMSILVSVIIYFFKDLSIAMGQTNKIDLVLSVWMPILAIVLFCSIGVIQINEK